MKILKDLLTGHIMYIKMSLLIMAYIPGFLNLITLKTFSAVTQARKMCYLQKQA